MRVSSNRLAGFAKYSERLIRFLGLWEINGWMLKVYGISADRTLNGLETIDSSMLAIGKEMASSVFTSEPTTNSYSIGYVIFHEGRLANWIILDWWADEIQIRHQLYKSERANPGAFKRVTDNLVACIWELKVIEFERQAWIDHILKPASGPDAAAYFGAVLPPAMY